MTKVKIYGAGSIGNHLAHASRTMGWDVLMCDLDESALLRTKSEIYPQRYGKWDEAIKLSTVKDAPKEGFDVIFIGTPPHTHVSLALDVLRNEKPHVLVVEKPLCTPSLEGAQELYEASKGPSIVLTGYNHTLCKNTKTAEEFLGRNEIGRIRTIHAAVQEHWGGIFKAHPWLRGPQDTYCGYSAKGGGATGEHSHGINIWQHFANKLNLGKITEVTATMDTVQDGTVDYDRIANIAVRTDKGFYGTIVQDVVTFPTLKYLRIQGEEGSVEWAVRSDPDHDSVTYHNQGLGPHTFRIPQKRTDDFLCEVQHIDKLLKGQLTRHDSPIFIERGLDTMLVIAAAYLSNKHKQTMRIDYSKGYSLAAITPIGGEQK